MKLPITFCHHDAFRRNLLARDHRSGTVAIDWSLVGFGRVGEEIGVTTTVSLSCMEVTASQARELDQVVFTGYVEGLRDVGWQGDVRQVRLGYTANAFLLKGAASMLIWLEILQNPEEQRNIESLIGRSFDDILHQWAELQPLLLDFAEEAYQLVDELT